jgi:hypothetical protein
MSDDKTNAALKALFAQLASDLEEAARGASLANAEVLGGNRNGAIGSLLAVEAQIDLVAALLALHRRTP